MADVYQVTGPLAVAKVGGAEQYLRRGTIVPAGVSDAQIKHLESVGLITKVDPVEAAPEPAKGIDEMTVAELKEYAAAHSVELGEASKKDEILAAVKAAQEPAEQA